MATNLLCIPEFRHNLGQTPMLCDTNLLVARFRPGGDDLEPQATLILEEKYDFFLTASVLTEVFHFCKSDPQPLFEWLIAPGRAVILPDIPDCVDEAVRWHEKSKGRLDIVDGLLLTYAKVISQLCGLARPIPIATADSEMMLIARTYDQTYSFLDINHFPDLDIQ